jgi:hypothetical protein
VIREEIDLNTHLAPRIRTALYPRNRLTNRFHSSSLRGNVSVGVGGSGTARSAGPRRVFHDRHIAYRHSRCVS